MGFCFICSEHLSCVQEVLQLIKFTSVGSERATLVMHRKLHLWILQAADTDDDSLFKAMFKTGTILEFRVSIENNMDGK